MRSLIICAGFAVCLTSFVGNLAAQTTGPVELGPPDAVASEPFTLIKGLRELSDGRVLVTDWIEGRLVVVDFATDTQRDLGRTGAGPSEFRLPGELIALAGDSTMLRDVGNARLSVIGPNLEFVRSMSIYAHGERFGMNPRAVDRSDRIYFGVSPFAVTAGPSVSDSVPIASWTEGDTGVVMIPGVKVKAYTPKPSGPSLGLPYIAFAKQDGWAVSSGGWVAVVRSDPYRVDWYGPGEERITGEEISYDRLPVTMNDRREHVRAFLASSMQSGRGEGGGMGLVPADAQSQREVDRIARTALFEDEFPPFVPGAVWMSGETVWVQRSLPAKHPPTFDVFDRSGAKRQTFTVGEGRRVVGFGRESLYATVSDEFELLRLERYPIPPGGR